MRFASVALFLIFLVISIPFCYSAQYSLTYDSNGNLISGDGKYRVYNSLNQLYQIYNGSNSSGLLLESYQYHPTEERVHVKTVYNTTGGIKETVYYISKSFVQVVNSSGEFNYTYVYQNGQLIAQKNPDGTKYFIVSDAEGSANVVTNSTGGVIENTSYSPFGEIVSGGTKSRYGYEDKEYDSVIKSVDFNFRRYNPKTILFEQPDTIVSNTYNPQELNRYMFEKGNPLKNRDDTGHNPFVAALLIGYAFGVGSFAWNNPIPTYNGDVVQYYIDSNTYTAKMMAHGAISGAAAVATVALTTSGGRFVAPSLTAKLAMAAIGSSEYIAHKSLDKQKIDPIEAAISGAANAFIPIPGPKKGTPYSLSKVTKNTIKSAINVFISNAVSSSLTSAYSYFNDLFASSKDKQVPKYTDLATGQCTNG